jgi:hypothetical protein
MTSIVVRVSVLSEGTGGVGKLNTEGRCEAIVLFLAVSFLSVCTEGVSRFCLTHCGPVTQICVFCVTTVKGKGKVRSYGVLRHHGLCSLLYPSP